MNYLLYVTAVSRPCSDGERIIDVVLGGRRSSNSG